MRKGMLSVAAALMLSGGFPSLPAFFDSGPIFLPPNKKKTGALKQRRASKKRRRAPRKRARA
jgi:hypothetical protein